MSSPSSVFRLPDAVRPTSHPSFTAPLPAGEMVAVGAEPPPADADASALSGLSSAPQAASQPAAIAPEQTFVADGPAPLAVQPPVVNDLTFFGESVDAPVSAPGAPLRSAAPTAAIEPVVPLNELPPEIRSPVLAVDPALEAMRGRVITMESKVIDLEARKDELEQLLEEYAFCQFKALGDLLDEHLRLKQEVLRQRAERSSSHEDILAAEGAAREYEAYQQAHVASEAPLPELLDDEREELKTLYRSAAMRCHPDRVDDAGKAEAHEMFLRTQAAYRRRDLDTMRLISRQLAAGHSLSASGDESTTLGRLEALLESLLDQGTALLLAIQSIKMQTEYRRAC